MYKMNRFFSWASIAASVIANTGCAAPAEPSGGDLDAIEQIAAGEMALASPSAGCQDDDEVDFSYTEIGPNQYMFYQRAPVDAPIDASWEPLTDFSEIVGVVLPGIATDFQWLDGGGPGLVPSKYQFTVGSDVIVEEVTELDEARHIAKYHLLEPALGIQSYEAVIKLVRAPCDRSVLYFIRDITLQPGVPVGPLAALIETEAPLFKAYVETSNP